ncbi:DUF4304 domain-containing protein [Paenibacillus sp. N4]|uniref:DUF4304 domain-containing protein n=1 Tax=Paenibacillus vietnamensis TaxID=2590547 RepID=UPI001CD075B1|nr:DUF4304 domain-containing protein [Paenibacillus vietnamensis]MCA0753727.1 DUF4304 domain-containing protein [Paenibacillus vietnamensis]
MSALTKEELIERLKQVFEEKGFKKSKTTWRKLTDDLILVLNVQGSQWNEDNFYINVGVYIKALELEQNPTGNVCHLRDRIEQNQTFESLVKEVLDWFEKHGEIKKLRLLNQQNSLPLMTMVVAKKTPK